MVGKVNHFTHPTKPPNFSSYQRRLVSSQVSIFCEWLKCIAVSFKRYLYYCYIGEHVACLDTSLRWYDGWAGVYLFAHRYNGVQSKPIFPLYKVKSLQQFPSPFKGEG